MHDPPRAGHDAPPGELKRTLGPWTLWGLGVGYVISGMYFGWNLGLPEAGPFGLLAATLMVTVLYATFVLGYAELACAIPRAGGAFVYADRALGPGFGALAGAAQCVEFVFAPPAIAAAIGAHVNVAAPSVPPLAAALVAYAVFTALNVYGVKASAVFELLVTVLAAAGLVLFAAYTAPRYSWAAFTREHLRQGFWGAFAAIPFAVWFYLGIEGLANVAEESERPQRDLARAFTLAMATLVALALVTFFCAVGVAGWRAVVYAEGSSTPSDSPLPLALGRVLAPGSHARLLLIGAAVLGLVASFHGLVLVAGRALFELGRMGYAPAVLGTVWRDRGTPAAALLTNLVVGCAALLTGRTAQIITLSVFGALGLYAVSMAAHLRLRRAEPDLPRPFRTPLHPYVPAVALVLSLLSLAALLASQPWIGLMFLALLGAAWARFRQRPL